MPGQRTDTQASYAERLWVPISWWLLGLLFALSLLVAVLFYLGPAIGIGIGIAVLALIGALFIGYGSTAVRVTPDRLWVGRANIEWRYVTGARALDAAASRQRRGPQADARAYLVLRPYLARAVEIGIDDSGDPTPYWLISSRTPERLAAAVERHLGRSRPMGQTRPTGSGDRP